jgi:hypothetical protein
MRCYAMLYYAILTILCYAINQQGHARFGRREVKSYDNAAMDYGNGEDVAFHVVKGKNESRLVSSNYNIRIKQDIPQDNEEVEVRGQGDNVNHQHANHQHSKKSSDISDLSNSSADAIETSHREKPVVYASLSMKLLSQRAESEEVCQKRVLKRFESENEYHGGKRQHYKYVFIYLFFFYFFFLPV